MSMLHSNLIDSSTQALLAQYPHWREWWTRIEIARAIMTVKEKKIEQLDSERVGRYAVRDTMGATPCGGVIVNAAALTCDCGREMCWHILAVTIWYYALVETLNYEAEYEAYDLNERERAEVMG